MGSTLLKNRATPEEQAAAATDTGWEDSFVRFHPDCREMIAGSPSRHGVDRNADFLADVVRSDPSICCLGPLPRPCCAVVCSTRRSGLPKSIP